MTLLEVWDAVAVDTIPSDAEYFLGYDFTFAALAQRFPRPKRLWKVATSGNPLFQLDYDICDCESGDFTFELAAQWALNKIRAKLGRPCIYVEVANKQYVTAALAALGLEWGRDVDCWLAWWNDVPLVLNGIFDGVDTGQGNVAHQYFNLSRYTYDRSVVLYDWVYPPGPLPPEVDMFDAIEIVAEGAFPAGSVFLNAGATWVGPLDKGGIAELEANKASIFKSTTNSVFHAKPVVTYPAT